MKTRSINGLALILILFVAAMLMPLPSCATEQASGGDETAADNTGMGGAELWARRCDKCHNVRPSETLSDTEWRVVMRHMRVRAKLNGDEERKILAFLQSGN